jgi:hypothetical protein
MIRRDFIALLGGMFAGRRVTLRMRGCAAELVGLAPEVIMSGGLPGAARTSWYRPALS